MENRESIFGYRGLLPLKQEWVFWGEGKFLPKWKNYMFVSVGYRAVVGLSCSRADAFAVGCLVPVPGQWLFL